MTVRIHDVGHGACASIISPNGKMLVVDTGHSESRPWHPSIQFSDTKIENLTISNFDNDHLSDFSDVLDKCQIGMWVMNWSLTGDVVVRMKGGRQNVTRGVSAALEKLDSLRDLPGSPQDLGEMNARTFYNDASEFEDLNNLSVARFFTYGGHKFIFPGDLEEAGWQLLLQRQDFRDELAGVTIFVASHHGRKSGWCKEVFDHCKQPVIAVISDRNKTFDTQETTNWYGEVVSGVTWNGKPRKVFTTRQYGDITFTIEPDGWNINSTKGT